MHANRDQVLANPLEVWQGVFGNEYTDRNVAEWQSVLPILQRNLGNLSIRSLLEVGCNRGHNLVALREFLGPDVSLVGIEPNAYARSIAQASGVKALDGSAFDLPFPDRSFDLVMTAGVLIHIPLDMIDQAMREIHRCSSRYLVAAEYYADHETPITYRGRDGLLWKRDFLGHYLRLFPDLRVLGCRYEPDWDRTHWWLLEKPA